jgi:predicted RNase H-like HicB family nuclease
MNSLRQTAIDLAERPYSMLVFLDEDTDGTLGYVALNPELEGCMSQGDTYNEAIENLNEARIDYIESMLEDNLAIPEPQLMQEPIMFYMPELLSYEDTEINLIPYDEVPRDLDMINNLERTIQSAASI